MTSAILPKREIFPGNNPRPFLKRTFISPSPFIPCPMKAAAKIGKLYRMYLPPEIRAHMGAKIGDVLVFTTRGKRVSIEVLR